MIITDLFDPMQHDQQSIRPCIRCRISSAVLMGRHGQRDTMQYHPERRTVSLPRASIPDISQHYMLTATRRNLLATSAGQWSIFSYRIAYSSELMKTDTRSSEIKNVSLSGMDRRGFASRATRHSVASFSTEPFFLRVRRTSS